MRGSYVNFVYSTAIALALAATLSSTTYAQKKYDPGATDTEIKIGNIMPYSGPASAYATIGKTEAAYFTKINLKAASTVGRSTLSLMTIRTARLRRSSKLVSSLRAMKCC